MKKKKLFIISFGGMQKRKFKFNAFFWEAKVSKDKILLVGHFIQVEKKAINSLIKDICKWTDILSHKNVKPLYDSKKEVSISIKNIKAVENIDYIVFKDMHDEYHIIEL